MSPLPLALARLLPLVVLALALVAPGARASERVAAGAALYEKYCALCHGPDGRGYAADNAPALVGEQFLSAADDAFLTASIALGRPGTPMAAYGRQMGGPLDDAQIADLVAYLRSLGPAARPLATPPRGSAKRGVALYAEKCASCHGDRSRRGTAVHLANPTFLALASDAFLHDAIARGRDGTQMQAFAGELDEQEIADVVAYLRSWAPGPGGVAAPAAPAQAAQAEVDPYSVPVVLNPEGAPPELTLREGRYVSVDEMKRALDEKRRMVIVDARAASEWQRERIPGSISIPYYSATNVGRIPNDGTWVIAYCACPHHASGVIVDELRRRGYPHTAVLDEGITVWAERGYPLAGNGVTTAAAGGR